MHYSSSSGSNGKRKDAPHQYDVRQAKQQRLYQQLSVQPETNGRSLLHSTHGVFDRQVDILFEAWTKGIPRRLPRKNRYYVVWCGHRCGIFLSWAECQPYVHEYPGAGHKSVGTFDEIVSNYTYETNKMNTDIRSKRRLLNHTMTKDMIAERLEDLQEQAHRFQAFDDGLDTVDNLEVLEDDGTEASGSCAPIEFRPRPTAATAGMLGSGVSSKRSSGSRESLSSSSSVLSSPARSHSIFSSSPPTSSYSGVMLPSETKTEDSLEGQEDHIDFTTANTTGVDLDFSDVAKSPPTRGEGRPQQKGRMNLHGLKQKTLSSAMGKNGEVVNQSIEGENLGVKFAAAQSSKAMEAVGHARDAKGKGVMSREEDFMAQIRELTEQNEGLKNLVGQMVDQK